MVQAFRRRPVSMLKSRAKQIVFWALGTKGCRWIWSFKNGLVNSGGDILSDFSGLFTSFKNTEN